MGICSAGLNLAFIVICRPVGAGKISIRHFIAIIYLNTLCCYLDKFKILSFLVDLVDLNEILVVQTGSIELGVSIFRFPTENIATCVATCIATQVLRYKYRDASIATLSDYAIQVSRYKYCDVILL